MGYAPLTGPIRGLAFWFKGPAVVMGGRLDDFWDVPTDNCFRGEIRGYTPLNGPSLCLGSRSVGDGGATGYAPLKGPSLGLAFRFESPAVVWEG